jgi:large subunit ribosomal protein L5
MTKQKLQSKMTDMRNIRIEKLTINIGAGKSVDKLEKGIKLIKHLTGVDPVKTVTQKRIPAWGLRPGLPIGCRLTLRGNAAVDFLKRILVARDSRLSEGNFDNEGNISFGVTEYIDIPGAKYDPAIGIMGFQVCLTLERPGFRIKRRRFLKRKIPKNHRIPKEDAIDFAKNAFGVKIGEAE